MILLLLIIIYAITDIDAAVIVTVILLTITPVMGTAIYHIIGGQGHIIIPVTMDTAITIAIQMDIIMDTMMALTGGQMVDRLEVITQVAIVNKLEETEVSIEQTIILNFQILRKQCHIIIMLVKQTIKHQLNLINQILV